MPDDDPSQQTAPEAPLEVLRAGKELFLRRLREIVGRAGVAQASVLEAFASEVGDAYEQLASAAPRDEFDEAGELTASRLTLMGDDDLEVDIRLRDLVNRLREDGLRDLWRSQLRYMTLLRRPTMKAAGNPVGPDVICQGLWAIYSESGIDLAQTLALLDRIEDQLRQQLPMLYREIDELLAAYGIQPATGHSAPISAGSTAVAPASGGGHEPANPLATLQQAMRQRQNGDQAAALGESMLQFPGGSEGRADNPPLDAAAMVMLKHLFARLTALEARSPQADAGDANAPPRSPLCALKAKDLDLPLGKPEAIALDTLALIFEAIFNSSELPDTVKAAIGRLQIPLLKLAIFDPSLFANSAHPARRLINRLARAAIGLPRSSGWEDPVCKRVGAVSAAVRDILARKDAALDPYLGELDALIAERDQAICEAATGYVQLLVAHEERQAAKQLTRNWLRASLARRPPPTVAAFLEKHWARLMFAAALDGGSDGPRWQQNSATASELIWSTEPKATGEERKQLAGMASSLIKRIGAGLDEIALAGPERTLFLNSLFDLQTAALRTQATTSTAPPAATDDAAAAVANGRSRTLEGKGLRVLVVGLSVPLPVSPGKPRQATATNWQVGDWLRFCVPERPPLTGLCCWQNASSGTVLLCNAAWGYAVAMPATALDQQLRSGQAQVISRIAIFDAAAERALKLLERS